jgi:hypothetical protein
MAIEAGGKNGIIEPDEITFEYLKERGVKESDYKKYFWKHSSSAQFSDLMQTVFETHPSFFRDRNYKDYYEEHCDTLKKLIEFGEKKGKKYFSLTNSYIPVLKDRLKNTKD